MGAFHAPTSPSAGPTCSRWRCACPATTTPTTWHGWGEHGDALYFKNPTDYVANLHGDHLEWLRGRLSIDAGLRAGPVGGHHRRAGRTAQLAGLLADKGIPHELDLWGYDVGARLAVVAAHSCAPPATDVLIGRTERRRV